jgi:hypothetical protein
MKKYFNIKAWEISALVLILIAMSTFDIERCPSINFSKNFSGIKRIYATYRIFGFSVKPQARKFGFEAIKKANL